MILASGNAAYSYITPTLNGCKYSSISEDVVFILTKLVFDTLQTSLCDVLNLEINKDTLQILKTYDGHGGS